MMTPSNMPFNGTRVIPDRVKKVGNYWDVYSLKAGRPLRLYSDLVYYFWVLIEGDPTITDLCEYPLRVRAKVDGRWFTSVLDMWYRTSNGSEVVCAIKSTRQLLGLGNRSRLRREMAAQFVWASQHQIPYCVTTEQLIWANPHFLSNWIYILSFLRGDGLQRFDDDLGKRIVRSIAAGGPMSLYSILLIFSSESKSLVLSTLFKQLHSGLLAADLSHSRLTGKTIFKLYK